MLTTRPPKSDVAFYRCVRAAVHAFSRLYWRLTVEGGEHLPEGPFVLAPVHRSNIDTLVVAMVTTRRMRFMGKASLWEHGLSAWLLSALGGFPVHRGSADREALRRCVEVIQGGEPLVIFPEGGRRKGPTVDTFKDGAAYIASRSGVPIVPVGIGGSAAAMPLGAKWLRPAKVHVIVGTPLYPKPLRPTGRVARSATQELTNALHGEIQRLFDQAEGRAGRRGR